MTAQPKERVRFGGIRAVAGSLGSIVVYGATFAIMSMAGGTAAGYAIVLWGSRDAGETGGHHRIESARRWELKLQPQLTS